LVTDDAEFWSNGAVPLVGREPLRAAFAGVFERFHFTQQFYCTELVIRDDLAFMRGTERNTLRPLDGSAPVAQEQRAFSLMRRGPDGTWRFWRGMTNIPPKTDQ
jgi:ketosteroid isomerase-like protein